MKKIIIILPFLFFMLNLQNVSAQEYYLRTINNVSLSEEEFLYLLNNNYSLLDIYHIDEMKYQKIFSEKLDTTLSPFYGKTGSMEKQLFTSIFPSNKYPNKMTYKTTLHWKKIPSTCNYDIITLSFNSKISDIVYGISFTQLYTINNKIYYNHNAYIKRFKNAIGVVFKLNENATTIDLELTYDIKKKDENKIITHLTTYSNYAHSNKKMKGYVINNNYSANLNSLSIYSQINANYEGMSPTKVYWYGKW